MKKQFTFLTLLGIFFGFKVYSQIQTFTYNYTGSVQTFTAPACAQATITAYGAEGVNGASTASGAIGGTAGLGGMTQGVVSLTAGQTLNIYVGGAGTGSVGGFNGGGNGAPSTNAGAGGGASDVRLNGTALSDRILVAGGGGGGGNAGCVSSTITGGNGGAGGGGSGTAGVNSVAGFGGQGGNGSIGGAAGIGCILASGTVGENGSIGVGGNAGSGPAICGAYVNGGGGGGGYLGGGGGGGGTAGTMSCSLNDQGAGGGGAGGSNYVATSLTSTTSTNGVNSGNGYIVISYSVISSPTIAVNSGSICLGNSFTISPSGANSYTIQGGNNIVSPSTETTYTVIGSTDGCISNVVTSTVSIHSSPSLSISSSSVSCRGGSTGSATVIPSGGTAPYSYFWSTAANTSTLSGLTAGVYTHTLTDDNGCLSVASTTITEPATLLVPQSSITNTIACNGQLAVVSVTATGGDAPYAGVGTFSVAAGAQTFTVTDNNGCALTTSLNITEPTAIAPLSSLTSSILCNGGNAVVAVTATGGTGALSGLGDYTVTAGVKTFTVTDDNSCAVTTTINVAEPSALVASSLFSNLCGSAIANVTVSATGGTGAYTGTGTFTATAGAYSYTVTDANACSNTTTITVTTNTAVSTFSTGMTAASCFGKSDATAWVNPVISQSTETPFTYTWTPGAANTRTITNIAGGVYTVNITAANGCAYTRTVDVKQPAVLMLDMQVSPSTTICPATTTTLSVSGAATYTWSTGSNNPKIVVTPTVTTNYSVTGTSFLGCTVMSSVTIVTSTTTCLGVNELDNASVLVYPNPATENINVQLSSQLSNATFEVIDALGKMVMIEKMENVSNTINISTLNSGVYFYQIKSGSRIIATQKFIKE